MKIHSRAALVAFGAALAAALLVAGCGRSPTDVASPRAPAAPVAQHVDNPAQTPMP
ncbi:MAG TPA: hypothetical protein VF092_13615 [Longimicrobium sp.]